MTIRNTLLSTVGTSFFSGNLDALARGDHPAPPGNKDAILRAYTSENWKQLAKEIVRIGDPSSRICGAEINTIEEIRKKKWLDLTNLIFLVSDTEAGKNTGRFLTEYFRMRLGNELQNIEHQVIERLQDEKPKDFKVHGLRNLVRAVGDQAKRFGLESLAIDATGGYKAQIAVAVVIGQALEIPVYYKHERFNEIIDFPPLPVSLDYELLARYADLLADLEKGETYSSDQMAGMDEALRVLLTEVEVEGTTLYELGPIGQIYLTGFRLRNPKPGHLIDATEKKEPTFGKDHHFPKDFESFVRKVWKEHAWIRHAHSVPYAKQGGIKGIGFTVEQDGGEYKLLGTMKGKDFGARFRIRITDESQRALIWAADQLNQSYR